jgi:hypothetical protein
MNMHSPEQEVIDNRKVSCGHTKCSLTSTTINPLASDINKEEIK